MTPAAAATAIRAAIEEGCRKDPGYLALVLRELATFPVPADAKERGWAAIQSELRTERCVSACPRPVVGQNAGSTGLAASFSGVTVTSPRQGATHSGALAAVGRGDEPLRDRHPRAGTPRLPGELEEVPMPRTFQDIVWPRFDDTIFDTDYYPARAKAQLAQEIVNATARRAWPEEETSYRPTAREQIARELLARAQEERAWRIQVKRQRRKAQRDWWQAHGLWVLVGLAAALAVLGLIDWDRVLGL